MGPGIPGDNGEDAHGVEDAMRDGGPGTVAATIRQRLEAALAPSRLDLVDDSQRHAGHAGARPGGESHFRLTVVAAAFAGLGRLERQRLVHGALGDLMEGPVHALSIRALTPEEEAAAAS